MNTPSNTKLSLGTTGVTISDTGFYQVTFGVAINLPNLENSNFVLTATTAGVSKAVYNVECSLLYNNILNGSGFEPFYGMITNNTVIVNVTSNPTTLNITFTPPFGHATNVTIQDPGTGGAEHGFGPCGYMTIIKLQPGD